LVISLDDSVEEGIDRSHDDDNVDILMIYRKRNERPQNELLLMTICVDIADTILDSFHQSLLGVLIA
jgi:hypothetical protein